LQILQSILNEVNKKQEQLEKLKIVINQQNEYSQNMTISKENGADENYKASNVLPTRDRCKF
jgi:hypothetical protein